MAVVYFGEAHEELTRRVLSLIELAGAHEMDDGVGRLGEIVLFQRMSSPDCRAWAQESL